MKRAGGRSDGRIGRRQPDRAGAAQASPNLGRGSPTREERIGAADTAPSENKGRQCLRNRLGASRGPAALPTLAGLGRPAGISSARPVKTRSLVAGPSQGRPAGAACA
jgi:hypothetical protein